MLRSCLNEAVYRALSQAFVAMVRGQTNGQLRRPAEIDINPHAGRAPRHSGGGGGCRIGGVLTGQSLLAVGNWEVAV